MCVGWRNCDFSILSEHFQELCEGFVVLMVPAERSGALSREPYEVCQNCATFVDIKEHGGCFFKLCKGEKASLTCWNLRGPQQNTAKCSDPQRSLVNLGQHERTQQNLAVHFRTSESRRETM